MALKSNLNREIIVLPLLKIIFKLKAVNILLKIMFIITILNCRKLSFCTKRRIH